MYKCYSEGVKGLQIKADELKNASWDARIRLSRQEEEELLEQLQGFFQVAEKALRDAALDMVPATFYGIKRQNVLRSDAIEPSLPPHLSLANAPDADDSSFNVPRIIEE